MRASLAFLGTCRIGIDVHPILYPHLLCAVPVKVFEYMANGAAVVTSYLPELHRLLGADGARHVVTVTEPAPAAYAAEIDRLLERPGRASRRARRPCSGSSRSAGTGARRRTVSCASCPRSP